ncbi:PREDICTED: uncharacterized protein LOC108564941 isoform X2 [Nicrophorus vespilloides]|uniref:Uncharacterized protein LOC108564941 isoform X2 n=1 Tax=Nicrophorus vespilloides TaxID=110193 RepID=A0ABM1MYI0_NICVS|nr:PREDICTED: uncharacterized protein LOC108564941 isoform X2 [Nicrophorus vespilloides]
MSVLWTNGENFILCPYGGKAHFIGEARFSTHVVKCQRSSNINLAICPYNADHRLQVSEYQHHVTTCEDRFFVDMRAYEYDNEHSEILYPIVEKKILYQVDSWDADDDPSYNPEEYCISEEIVRRLDVEPGSVRKGFRKTERARFQELARLTQNLQINVENKENNPVEISANGNSASNGYARANGISNGFSGVPSTNANINSNTEDNGSSQVTSMTDTTGSVSGSASDASSDTNFPPLGSERRTRGRGRVSRGVNSGRAVPRGMGRGRGQL